MAVLYGIKNCDSVKKARAWLDARQFAYQFHDYRIDGLDAGLLQSFVDRLSLDAILNQRSASWRNLADSEKHNLNPEQTFQLLLNTPTLLKRPIFDNDVCLIVGFVPDRYILSP